MKHPFTETDSAVLRPVISPEGLIEENRILREEIRVARQAAEITASLVVRQFEETERNLQRFQTANAQRKAVLNAAKHISIIATNIAGRIILFNTGAENLLGYTAKDVIGRITPLDFHLSEELAEFSKRVESRLGCTPAGVDLFFQCAARGLTEPQEWTYVRRNKSRFPVSMSINPLLDSDGLVSGILCIAVDITEAKRSEQALRESEKKYRLLVRNLPNIVFRGYPNGFVDFFDDKITRLTGWPRRDFTSRKRKWSQIVLPEDRPVLRESFRRAMGGNGSFLQKYRICARTGEIIWIECAGQIVFDAKGRFDYVTGAFLNVTERVRAEAGLQKARDELESRVARRTAELTRINQKLASEIRERRQAESALRKSEQQLAGIMASVTDRLSMIDRDNTIVWANPVARRIFGEDIIGRKCYAAYMNRTHPCDFCCVAQTFADGKIHEMETEAYGIDGKKRLFWVTTSVTAWDDEGRPVLVVENSRDITARKEAEVALRKSEQKYRSIFENAREGIFQSTPSGRFITANPAFVRLLGYPNADQMMSEIKDIRRQLYVDPSDRDRFKRRINKTGFVSNFETRFFRCDRSIIHVSLNAHAVHDETGQIRYFEGMLEDVTERKRAEKWKIEKEAAEAATRAKSEFLANMSHEIRTPMNAILGLTELVLKTELTEKQHDYLEKIHISGQSLLGIINDVLDYSKIEAGKIALESVEFVLSEVVHKAADILSESAARKRIELSIRITDGVPGVLVGDPLRLTQIMTNLIGNAVKFTENGEVRVVVGRLPSADDIVVLQISVQDTGIGVPASDLPRLFDFFTQADGSTTRKFGGTGLGLAICKQFVKMMGGEIWVESETGVGSTFTFTARFQTGAQPEPHGEAPPPELHGLRVLVADDNEASREIYSEILKSFGFSVLSVGDGIEALDVLERAGAKTPVDLILLDWLMPGLDGLETARRIRKRYLEDPVPIILTTAFGRDDITDRASEAGIHGILLKPIKQSVLFDAIMEAFGRSDGRKSRRRGPVSGVLMASSDGKRPRILLVEDNRINRQVALEFLQGAGVDVDTAENGAAAVAAVYETEYDAVLMDVQMPELDGFEATDIIRSDPKYAQLPIIAMTAHAMKGDREKCLACGMNDYIPKPLERRTLLRVLSDCLHAPRAGGEDPRCPGAEDQPPHFPGLDISSCLARLGGNRSLMRQMMAEFIRSHTDAGKRISEAWEQGDRKAAVRMAHNLKGVAGVFSASVLREAALNLETALQKASGVEMPKAAADAFESALSVVVESMEKIAGATDDGGDEATEPAAAETADTAPGTESKDDLGSLFHHLADLLDRRDMDAQEHLPVIRRRLKSAGIPAGDGISRVEAAVNRLDYQEARRELDSVMAAFGCPIST